MYHIVALVYLIVAGQSIIGEPARVSHKMVFKDIDSCQSFMKSETFEFQRAALADMMRNTVKLPVHEGEDTPDFAITITASCEEDTTL